MKLTKPNLQHKLPPTEDSHGPLDSNSTTSHQSRVDFSRHQVFSQLDQLTSSETINKRIGIAVSGGSDSLGLLCLSAEWAKLNNWHLQALTIDHGMRPEAAQEAVYVQSICETLNIPHTTMNWRCPQDQRATQENARMARHLLFCEWAKRQNIQFLMLGHTLDDRLETLLIRESSNSSEYGLAAMPSQSCSPIWPEGRDLKLLRPANNLTRQDLSAILIETDISWVCDPSNQDDKYERVRIRKKLEAMPQQVKQKSIEKLKKLTLKRQKLVTDLTYFLKNHVVWRADGSVELRLSDLFKHPLDIQNKALERILICVSGSKQNVGLSRVISLLNALNVNTKSGKITHCLGKCWLIKTEDTLQIYAMPTKRATTKNSPQTTRSVIKSSQKICYMGRFDIRLSPQMPDSLVLSWDEAKALGYAAHLLSENKRARRSMPVLIPLNTQDTDKECLPAEAYTLQSLHSVRNNHLSDEIFL
ncbi:tRNA lysidine(34) synthetase TilS [Hirschia baltica]|uniref:tRNA(Ile)-lysidine synthase n=1 Tax=Hirschia baltica (strain ATCC 49814 / DSM 5838 / IFAM 1418) TaxID=582402 RepID=C6XND6_HIRBI|nr:tRNA lysidine(34) synthetase TilS [Hirschia baltica]ACT60080.1 tRNA(Ile)-lysidine synthetase [Hirschia baltica ATCC 49814]